MATQYLQQGLNLQQDLAPSAAQKPAAPTRYLFGPVVDFLCLGGSSLLILPLLLLVPIDGYKAQLAAVMMLVAHLVNHPHFAHSYQIFYRGYRTKAFTPTLGRNMQIRYLIAGLAVPLMLAGFFGYCLFKGDASLLGYGGNVMALFVGWHYVKQGYGMLMVDAALKRQFLSAAEKKVLLINAYAVWVAAWVGFNDAVNEQNMWGLEYYTFAVPTAIVAATSAAALLTSAVTAWTFFSRWRSTGSLPVNGVVAYGVSLYIWLMFVGINPLWGLVVPALHSLQYLVVVWRFQTNYERAQLATTTYKAGSLARKFLGTSHWGHLALFCASGVAIGFVGFWGLPLLLTAFVPYNAAIFGGTLFLFFAWIGINVHHYFLDNVMWRRENPDTKRYLFG
jgi:hypothetical protein